MATIVPNWAQTSRGLAVVLVVVVALSVVGAILEILQKMEEEQ